MLSHKCFKDTKKTKQKKPNKKNKSNQKPCHSPTPIFLVKTVYNNHNLWVQYQTQSLCFKYVQTKSSCKMSINILISVVNLSLTHTL